MKPLLDLTIKLRDFHRKLDKSYKKGKDWSDARKHLKDALKSKNNLVLLAEFQGQVVGFSLGRIQPAGSIYVHEKIGFIFDVYLEPDFRRKGIVRSLLEKQNIWFKKNRIRFVELYVDVKNKHGFNAWKKHGFRPIMVRKRLDLRKV